MFNNLLQVAGLMGASAVALGAFGAHGLAGMNVEPKLIESWKTAAHYHLIHSLAVLYLHSAKIPNKQTPAKLFILGTLLFSGSIYTLVLTKLKVGIVTPIGGTLLISGWISLIL
eukprot:snap_masked-scaffold_4-processed-gene-17.18-mRNA-1 protein AED:0.02 eAED:0.02 QI:0/-1/0/1/-1/1/1/0/113